MYRIVNIPHCTGIIFHESHYAVVLHSVWKPKLLLHI